ncbi:hypothetical protein [Flavobacterium difficile]|uniref:Lipoprotein n=1 Tax=Flavobacterium difficile TaxID=2709659 RepID=A0ABX0I538_9FLAO|nr:hypothetical protein [Flavobacterium difficile]NHM02298.1 hypothetical protein [Flavobacterium difficile]
MKKVIILSALILSTLVSCSTDDELTYTQESTTKNSSKQSNYSLRTTSTDSINRLTDSINGSVNPKPIKP